MIQPKSPYLIAGRLALNHADGLNFQASKMIRVPLLNRRIDYYDDIGVIMHQCWRNYAPYRHSVAAMFGSNIGTEYCTDNGKKILLPGIGGIDLCAVEISANSSICCICLFCKLFT